ncbi:c-type cytochrome biogenesis protein CcmI [Parasulfitobacter algicola]|uniref:C-type cytochrome biogenesis protein CcmI n=1 Tax=Parasulfitobacter algicola TaxID=2614809 RepID=A0ABX2ITZ3_9RHOB|nr:c-type cytochrome biogenesis protein CcmI [Sulfitobacter algicola]NSX56371.1 c-type cytochrome biogenesis protein CcmI [Sulfitobacter algicola]
MIFWILTALLALTITLLVVVSLLRRQGRVQPAVAYDMQIYRDQLKEIERDLARNVITDDEAGRLRTEVSRRLLEADRKFQKVQSVKAPAETHMSGIVVGFIALVIVGGSFAIYTAIGTPGYGDLPHRDRMEASEIARENRPSQAVAEAEIALRRAPTTPPQGQDTALMDRLRAILQENPDDLQGQMLLVSNEIRLQNFAAAHVAQAKVVELKGDQATAEDHADLAELLILAANGYVSPQAETALEQALARDNMNGRAQYYSGLMFSQTGRPDLAFRIWRQQLDQGPPDAPWIRPIMNQIEGMAMRAGVRYTPPDIPFGPSLDDMAAAENMTPEERTQMIRGMVNGLSDRLSSAGGPPEEWARLIRAYGVLGETDRARAVWEDAQQAFEGLEDALDIIESAAVQAGVAG